MNNNYQDNSPIYSNYNNINNLCRSNTPLPIEKKKLSLKTMKNNTISSLNDVECFLNKLQHTIRYIKLYKLLK